MAKVHVIGAGTPTPTPTRFGSSFVVETSSEQIMIDCGPAATAKMVQAGLWPTEIDYLFFTHHHFDHDIDYPCFLLCRWDQSIGKENQLQVYGPNLTEKITEGIIGENGLFSHDWKARAAFCPYQRQPCLPKTSLQEKYSQARTGSDRGRRRTRSAVFGLAGLQTRHAGWQYRVHR